MDDTSEEKGAERRRDVRLNKVLGAELTYGDQVVKARLFVINISASGFRATSHERLPESDDLAVQLTLNSKEPPIEARVAIRWQRELAVSGMFELGFEFLQLDELPWKRLSEFIRVELEKASKTVPLDLSSPWRFGKTDPTY
ncbi:MAG: PilZ domain-containing protein [Candidatus Eremiobacterota bacterium]